MKKIVYSLLLSICLLLSLETFQATEKAVPTEDEVYDIIIGMKEEYPEGMKWNNDNFGKFNGGYYSGGYGCAGFAFILSDAAFGELPAVMLDNFTWDDIKVGDILRINNDTHSVVVLEVKEDTLVITEGNYGQTIHWGRKLSKEKALNADYILTRYQTHEHEWDDGSITVQPTCVGGQIIYNCETCTEIKWEFLSPVSEHVYESVGEVIREATCSEKGIRKYNCVVCSSYIEKDDIPALGHDYKSTVIEPTVTEKGFTSHTCTRCYSTYVDTYVDPLEKWIRKGDYWYYYKGGACVTGWLKDGGTWYYMNSSGAMETGWIKDGGKWYYMNSSGAMVTGWVKDGGKSYYMNSSGAMVTGWLKDGGTWYYMNSSGAMATGWIKDGGKWYYLNSSGAMARNTWIGNYYVNASGVWVN